MTSETEIAVRAQAEIKAKALGDRRRELLDEIEANLNEIFELAPSAKDAGVSQAEFCRLACVTRVTLGNWKRQR